MGTQVESYRDRRAERDPAQPQQETSPHSRSPAQIVLALR